MFTHLDDPRPPTPEPEVVEYAIADGRRRLARKRLAVGVTTALTAVFVIGTALLSTRSSDSDAVVVAGSDGAGTPKYRVVAVVASKIDAAGSLRAAADSAEYETLWGFVGQAGAPPAVYFTRGEVVVSITIPDNSCTPSAPELTRFTVSGEVLTPTFEEESTACDAPPIPTTFIVAIERESVVPNFTLRLPGAPVYDFAERRLEVSVRPPATAPTTSTTPRPRSTEVSVGLIADEAPATGLVVVDGDALVVLDEDGRHLAEGDAGGFSSTDRGQPLELTQEGRLVRIRAPARPPISSDDFPSDCVPELAEGALKVARCGPDAPSLRRIEVRDASGRRTLIEAPPKPPQWTGEVLGHWSSAQLSPNGTSVLAMWSGECEVPTTFLLPVNGGPVFTVDGHPLDAWADAAATTPVGWSASGKAWFVAGAAACGTGLPIRGVYAVTPGGRPRAEVLYHATADFPRAWSWRRGPQS